MEWYCWYYVIVAVVIIVASLTVLIRDGIKNKREFSKYGSYTVINRSSIIFSVCLGLFWPVAIAIAIILAVVVFLFFKESGRVV